MLLTVVVTAGAGAAYMAAGKPHRATLPAKS
jgi:hypothetical protein